MTDLAKRLTESADWVEANAQYHFDQNQKHGPLDNSLRAVKAMKEAAALLRTRDRAVAKASNEACVTIDEKHLRRLLTNMDSGLEVIVTQTSLRSIIEQALAAQGVDHD